MRVIPNLLPAVAGAWLMIATPANAAFYDLGPRHLEGGDCSAVASQAGGASTWVGEFSGNYYDDFQEMTYPVSARGCFASEGECRAWQNAVSADLGRGTIVYARCTRGVRDGY